MAVNRHITASAHQDDNFTAGKLPTIYGTSFVCCENNILPRQIFIEITSHIMR